MDFGVFFWNFNFVHFSPVISVGWYAAVSILPLVLALTLITSWENWALFRVMTLFFAVVFWKNVVGKEALFQESFSAGSRIVDSQHYPLSVTILSFALILLYLRLVEYGYIPDPKKKFTSPS